MLCKLCSGDLTSEEFYPQPLSPKCNHVISYCCLCLTKLLEKQTKCPDCSYPLSIDDIKKVESYEKHIFSNTSPLAVQSSTSTSTSSAIASSSASGKVKVVKLDGSSYLLQFSSDMEVSKFKCNLERVSKVEPGKQRLLFGGKELTIFEGGKLCLLGDYNIQPGDSIHFIVLLYAFSDGSVTDGVVFDLHWGYPGGNQDFLDGTCIVYTGKTCNVVDYNTVTYNETEVIFHSGDELNEKEKTGHHRIIVKIPDLPETVTTLFFVLSAWNSPTIGSYPNVAFTLYEQKQPTKELCSYQLTQAHHSRAVVMCALVRRCSSWEVIQCGITSDGNARNYGPILKTINSKIIEAGLLK